jgi:F0F1-type ATP synthase assembly protein I
LTDTTGNKKPPTSLWQYAGMASQFLVSIGLGVFIGYKVDQWMNTKIPLFVWLLPLLIIIGTIYRMAKDTRKKD